MATIALHHGRRFSLARVREAVRTDLRGTTAMGLIEGCERLGFHARGVHAAFEALAQVPMPAVAHWEEEGRSHYVVLHRITKRRVVVADPARGVRHLTHGEVQKHWSGVLILVTPDEDLARGDTVAESEPSWRRLLHLLAGQRRDLAEAALAAVLLMVLGLGTAVYIQALLDSALALRSVQTLHLLGVAMLIVILARAVLGVLRSYFLVHVGQRIYACLYTGYYRHLLRLPVQFFDNRRVGELISRLSDSGRIRELLTGTTASVAVDLIVVVGPSGAGPRHLGAAQTRASHPLSTEMHMKRPTGFAAAAALLCGACASGGAEELSWTSSPPASLFLREKTPAPGQQCTMSPDASVPALDALFDSAAVAGALRAVPGSGAAVFSVAVHRPSERVRDPIDSVRVRETIDTARVVESTLPAERARQIAEVLRQNVRPSVRGGFLLRVDLPGPQLRRAASITCLPAVRNGDGVQRLLRSAAQEGLRGAPVVDISIREDGSTGEVVVRQSSGDIRVDQAAARIAEAMEFHPFLVNRIPTAFVLRAPVAIGQ